jgi:hypothetical protein
MIGILVPISFFFFLAAIILVPRYFKSQERQQMQQTIRSAIERGQQLPPEMIDAMTRDVRTPPSPGRDLRAAIVWLAIAIGLAGFGWAIQYYSDWDTPFLAIAALPAAIGVAFLLLAIVNRSKK